MSTSRLEAFSDGVIAILTNLHLLFWLSLVPFATRWMDEAGFASVLT